MTRFSIGLIILIGGWALFAYNSVGLSIQTAMAKVVKKKYSPSGPLYETSYTASLGATPITKNMPEQFSVTLNINGKMVEGGLTQEQFKNLQEGQTVPVYFQKQRLTGKLQFMGLAIAL